MTTLVDSSVVVGARIARDAYLRSGEGRHPAGSGFGDGVGCVLAKHADAPLPFVGGDVARTDVRAA